MITERDHDWRTRANCRDIDPEDFILAPGYRPTAALKICDRCDVRLDCLAFTLRVKRLDGHSLVAGGWHFGRNGKAQPHPNDVASGLYAEWLAVKGGEAEHAIQS